MESVARRPRAHDAPANFHHCHGDGARGSSLDNKDQQFLELFNSANFAADWLAPASPTMVVKHRGINPAVTPLLTNDKPGMMLRLAIHLGLILLFLAATSIAEVDAGTPTDRVKVAAVAFDPAWGDLDGNIARMAAGIEEVAKQGVRLAVLPETATTGYIFDSFAMVKPYLDTVPGKATDALEKITRTHHMYVSVGLAEIDPASGLAYNSAALIGPNGYIGKYRKHGLNAQDQLWATAGNLGFPVFDTEIGRISLLICYDDTYWQYARLAALDDVDIIAWSSVSDRVMPGTPAAQAMGDHSTVANVQYLSAVSGAWVIASTRNGIEENPITRQRLYYNGGSSIWNPQSKNIAQLPVMPPEVLPSGVHGVAMADIAPADAAPVRAALLARRRPEMYGLLALHRAPTDAVATATPRRVKLMVEGGDLARPAETVTWHAPPSGGLAVLPALFRYGPDRPDADYQRLAEPQGGASEAELTSLASKGRGYVVGSYPERDGDAVFHTVALAAPNGEIIARYRATHLERDQTWAKPGDQFVVVQTPLGRIALVVGEELAVPEVFGVYSAERADIVAAPSGRWAGTMLETDPKLFNKPYPHGTPFTPWAAAALGQFWVAAAGWERDLKPAALLLGPDPVIATAPRAALPGERVEAHVVAPWVGTWINQGQLIGGQEPWSTLPLVLPVDSARLAAWRHSDGQSACCQ
jgi:predicted amidohydrolase